MAIPHASPGIPVGLIPTDEALSEVQTRALIKDEHFETIRMAVPKDFEACRGHKLAGPITVQCLAGWITLTLDGDESSLQAGQWTFVPPGVPHTIIGVEDSLVLLTVIFR